MKMHVCRTPVICLHNLLTVRPDQANEIFSGFPASSLVGLCRHHPYPLRWTLARCLSLKSQRFPVGSRADCEVLPDEGQSTLQPQAYFHRSCICSEQHNRLGWIRVPRSLKTKSS